MLKPHPAEHHQIVRETGESEVGQRKSLQQKERSLETVPFAETWMDLESVIQREVRKGKTNTGY